MNKKRILWASDLVTPTGFSRVAHSIIKHLKNEYEITGVGVNYHGDPHEFDFAIFPANNTGAYIYGENRVCELLSSQKFDLLYILNDAWVINRYLQAIKKNVEKDRIPKIVVYFPVDSNEHDREWYENFDIVTQPVTYTEYARWVVRDANPTLDIKIIPHGVDTDLFFKKYPTRAEAKNKFFEPYLDKMGDLSNSFIVLNANRNQPRKKLDITMKGFAKFSRNKPKDVKIYMHCGIVDASINVDKLATRYGIADRLIVSSAKRGVQVVPDWRLNEIYNATDVGINTGMGEGWGLTSVEHAATGAVQVVPDHSACRELFSDCGVLLKTKVEFTFDNSMTVGRLTDADEVAQKLQLLYENRDKMEEIAERGFKKFTSEEYSWKRIAGLWNELFKEVLNDKAKSD